MNPVDHLDRDSHPDDELLAGVALGEPDIGIDDHLAGCQRCFDEVAALRETLALARSSRDVTFAEPPAAVWDAVVAATLEDSVPVASVTALASRRRGVPAWLATTAAAVTLLLGIGVGAWVSGSDPEPAPEASVVGTAQLASLDESAADRGTAQVRRHDDRVVLHVQAVDLPDPDGIREVWLINTDGARMVSLGLLATGEAGDFTFPEHLLEEGYRIVDISYEPDDGDPVHSGQSLARGTLEI